MNISSSTIKAPAGPLGVTVGAWGLAEKWEPSSRLAGMEGEEEDEEQRPCGACDNRLFKPHLAMLVEATLFITFRERRLKGLSQLPSYIGSR